MSLKFINDDRTSASFNGAYFLLAAPDDWDSIGDGPMREAVKEWIAAGNRPELATTMPPIIASISRRQARLALLEAGKLDIVEAAIEAIADPAQQRAAQIEYEADTWERGNAFLQSMWAQLGGTEAELDELFTLAATL